MGRRVEFAAVSALSSEQRDAHAPMPLEPAAYRAAERVAGQESRLGESKERRDGCGREQSELWINSSEDRHRDKHVRRRSATTTPGAPSQTRGRASESGERRAANEGGQARAFGEMRVRGWITPWLAVPRARRRS